MPLHRFDTLIVNHGEAQALCDQIDLDEVVSALATSLLVGDGDTGSSEFSRITLDFHA